MKAVHLKGKHIVMPITHEGTRPSTRLITRTQVDGRHDTKDRDHGKNNPKDGSSSTTEDNSGECYSGNGQA